MGRGGGIRLPVPHSRQQREGWCVPACVEMTLLHLRGCYGPGIECLTQAEIAKLCGTTEGGTRWGDTEQLSEYTLRFIPSIEYNLEKNKTIEDINVELSQNKPVLAFVQMEADHEKYEHALLVTGLEMSGNRVYYNNPMGKPDENVDIGSFLAMWAKDFCMWTTNIGHQRMIEDYL